MVTLNVGVNGNGRVRGATNNFLNGHNYSSQPGIALVFMRGVVEGDIKSLFYVFHFTTRER